MGSRRRMPSSAGLSAVRRRFVTMPHRYTLIVAYWFAFFATLIFAAFYATHSWHRYEKNSRARLRLTATTIAVASQDLLRSQASRLQFLAEALRQGQTWRHPAQARALLLLYKKASPDIAAASVIAPDGQMIAGTISMKGGGLPNFRKDSVIWPGFARALHEKGIYIHRPIYGPLVGHWVMRLSETVFGSDGKPLFLVTTPLRFRSLEGFFANLPLAQGLAVGILRNDFYIEGRSPVPHGDLRVLLTKPQTGILARTLQERPLMRQGFFNGFVTADHKYRCGAYVRLKGYPLVAFADVPRGLWMATWWHHHIEVPLIFLFAALVFSGFAYNRIQIFTERWEQEKERQKTVLHGMVVHDPLTGLLNRAGLMEALKRAMERAKRFERLLAVGFLDIDDFKAINDRYGHLLGDEVLKELAGRLDQALRGTDRVIRPGGDEFVLLIEGLRRTEDLDVVIEEVRAALARPYIIGDLTLTVGVSLGLTLYPLDPVDADELVRHADWAMYTAKNRSHGACSQWVRRYDMDTHPPVADEEGVARPPGFQDGEVP